MNNTISDPLQIKTIEKLIKRPLTEEERLGRKQIRVYLDEVITMIKIDQVSLQWLSSTNSLTNYPNKGK